jgi:hypothetical protein
VAKKERKEPEVNVEAVPEEAAVIATVSAPRTWNGYVILECPESSCKYDTIYERELQEHVLKAHTPPPAPTPARLVTLVDRFGNEQREE